MVAFAVVGACSNELIPEDTVSSYLKGVQSKNHEQALSNWETLSVGMIDDSLNEKGKLSRINSRIGLEKLLYTGLSETLDSFTWTVDKSIYYQQNELGYIETDQARNANLATVQVKFAINYKDGSGRTTKIGFNLWMTNNGIWRIVGLDMSTSHLLTLFQDTF